MKIVILNGFDLKNRNIKVKNMYGIFLRYFFDLKQQKIDLKTCKFLPFFRSKNGQGLEDLYSKLLHGFLR